MQRSSGAHTPRSDNGDAPPLSRCRSRHNNHRFIQCQRRVAGRLRIGRYVYEINLEAARLARRAVDERPRGRYVAGSVGPTGKAASLSPDVERPAFRNVTFEQLGEHIYNTDEGLTGGGCDIILIETVFDLLNAKAAVSAYDKVMRSRGARLPLMLSASVMQTRPGVCSRAIRWRLSATLSPIPKGCSP